MANTKSAKKSAIIAEKNEVINRARRSRIRTFVRKVEDAIKANDEVLAREAFKKLEPELMRGVTKGIYKLNTASRKLTRLASQIRKINAAKA